MSSDEVREFIHKCNHSYQANANTSFCFACNSLRMETLDRRIKRLREAKGLSQQMVADKLGVSRVAVTKWENGMTANLKLSNLLGFCELFGISVEELVRGTTQREKERQEKKNSWNAWKAYESADLATRTAIDLLLAGQGRQKQLTAEAQASILLIKSIATQELTTFQANQTLLGSSSNERRTSNAGR